MPPLIDGLIAAAVVILLVRAWSLAHSRGIAKGQRFSAGVMVALLAIALFMMREIGLAILAASGAWILLFGQHSAHGGYKSAGASRESAGAQRKPPAPSSSMSRAEAFSVLGLKEGASESEIRTAHRRLMMQIHPDRGGSNYLAAKINQAKDVLVGR
ncbi:MAG TPA: DnaJ domain-containing protein [Micropepsaceae bacterium]|nr:DnaJ domain-containing protein [Micropepsaceae bacterium]